mmetsp:Transcript_42548/g.102547  ORF Transcript_42548/g.102547 Transcript_42548/m.102547 type:complete len:199 (-) Transcript_42548:2524-3120(-)
MPRDKKFNKRGGGQRLDAQSAEEIEQRNARLAEFEEQRATRRAAEDDEEDDDADADDGDAKETAASTKPTSSKPKEDKPVKETSAAEHKKNLSKLEEVRKRREEAEKRRKAEEELEVAMELERKAKIESMRGGDDSDDDGDKKKKKKSGKSSIPKLSKIEIKKMKPAQMKEALKERGLDIQGNAKALTARLIEYEEKR